MTTYTKQGYFGYAGGGKNGATVDLWAASRFSGFPAENDTPPVGSPDAGPVVTADTFGGPGGYYIAGIATVEDYFVRVQYGGNTYWSLCPAGTLGGQSPAAVGITEITSSDSSITVTDGTGPTVDLTNAGSLGGWPSVDGSGAGHLNAQTALADTVGYVFSERGSGGFHQRPCGARGIASASPHCRQPRRASRSAATWPPNPAPASMSRTRAGRGST